MIRAFINMWKIPELRNRLLFTIGMLVIYRIGFWIPLPGVDSQALAEAAKRSAEGGGAFGQLAQFMSIFTGGSLSQSTLFGLGIMPYISAAIIFQLLATVVPSLEQLQKEGPAGRQKILEYTRYATVGLCLIQAVVILKAFQSNVFGGRPVVYADYAGTLSFWFCGLIGLTAGTIFLMWLGEQVDKYGIGNGASLIITAGILSRMPAAITTIVRGFSLGAEGEYKVTTVAFLIMAFVFVIGGAVLITQGQRRIPVQQAKHTRGRRVYGGQRSYLPLRVNHGGVMPIIFASALLILPAMLLNWLASAWRHPISSFLQSEVRNGEYLYELLYIGLIYFFAYFWTTVQFQPKEMATQLRDHGSFIPGLRPGPRTAEYLERVMERITYVGAGFLAAIAVIPSMINAQMGIPFFVAAFLGGTGLLIVVSVSLDFVQRIEAQLLMRNYQGFLGEGGSGRGPRIRGSRR